MIRRFSLAVLLALLLGAPVLAAPVLPPASKETIVTPQGTLVLWYRTPARESDLEMPLFRHGKAIQSFVYRVRDRKKRDMLRYARTIIATTYQARDIQRYYTQALGEGVTVDTDAATGNVTLCDGVDKNFRLITIIPKGDVCHIRLERVHRYAIPPRAYTEREQRVMRLVDDVAQQYRVAAHIRYTLQQRELLNGAPRPEAPDITKRVELTRPATLSLEVDRGKDAFLRAHTEANGLLVQQPQHKDIVLPLAKDQPLAPETLPAMADDPVARLMLGKDLITPATDYMMLQRAPGLQSEVVLTFPEDQYVLHLFIDPRAKIITRCQTMVSQDSERRQIDQAYSNVVLDAKNSAIDAAPSRQSLPSGVPAVTPAHEQH